MPRSSSPPPRRTTTRRVADALNKRDDFSNPKQAAYLALVRTASDLGAPLAELFRTHGITMSSYNALRVLRGHHPGGLPSQDIGPQLLDRGADITRLVDRLVKQGWAERSRDEADGRVKRVQITRKGLGLLKRLDEPVMAIHDAQFSRLSEAELDRLMRLLEKARDEPG
ncbi:MAG: MarR family transcriptional regulator [Planctomycetota bacterium]